MAWPSLDSCTDPATIATSTDCRAQRIPTHYGVPVNLTDPPASTIRVAIRPTAAGVNQYQGPCTKPLGGSEMEIGPDSGQRHVDPRQAPAALAGRRYDQALLAELPAHVDPWGAWGVSYVRA